MKTPRRRDSGVSLGRFISFKNPHLPPFSKVGLEETSQQRPWGIEKGNKKSIGYETLKQVQGDKNRFMQQAQDHTY
jgi:hypothetical protein